MKILQNNSEVEIGGVDSQPQEFRIKASREAFQILSSSLYNDKILAIVRELSANAYDAHVAAGKKETPFELHLPTYFEQYFSIKDYGVGLAENEVMELYCTYFGSDKQQSNEFVGALGLGSKSPFSYCEGFTVTSRYNGKLSVYSCFIGETGTPQVQKQSEEDTELPNGLEVQFPVRRDDIQEFKNKAEIALEFFNPVPICNTSLSIKKTDYSVKTEFWGIRTVPHTHHTTSIRAIQGMVQYSVGNIDESRMDDAQKSIIKLPIDVFFPIGELAVTPSRETLSNDERTISNILKMVSKISEGYIAEVKKKINVAKSRWEAETIIDGLTANRGYGGDAFSNISDKLWKEGKLDGQYDHFKLDSKMKFKINQFDYDKIMLSKFASSYRNRPEADKTKCFYDEEKRKEVLEQINKGLRQKEYEVREIEPNKRIVFVFGDVSFGGEKYIHYFLQQAEDNQGANEISTVYLISRINKDVTTDHVIKEGKAIVEKLGNAPFMLLSALRDKYYTRISKATSETIKRDLCYFDTRQNLNRNRDGYTASYWRKAWQPIKKNAEGEFDIPDERKLYVPLKKLQPTTLKYEYSDSMKELIGNCRQAGLIGKDEVIYGMPENGELIKEARKIKQDPEWVEFSKYVWDELLKIVTPEMEVKLSLAIKKFVVGDIELMFPEIKQQVNINSPINQFIKQYEQAKQIDKTKAEALAQVIAQAAKHQSYELKHITDFEKEWKDILDKYPLIRHVGLYKYDPDLKKVKKDILEYIQLMDEKRNFEELIKQQDEDARQLMQLDSDFDGQIVDKESNNDVIQ